MEQLSTRIIGEDDAEAGRETDSPARSASKGVFPLAGAAGW